jgi:hypothetical protein
MEFSQIACSCFIDSRMKTEMMNRTRFSHKARQKNFYKVSFIGWGYTCDKRHVKTKLKCVTWKKFGVSLIGWGVGLQITVKIFSKGHTPPPRLWSRTLPHSCSSPSFLSLPSPHLPPLSKPPLFTSFSRARFPSSPLPLLHHTHFLDLSAVWKVTVPSPPQLCCRSITYLSPPNATLVFKLACG